jgi:hypothetical protein
MFTTISTSSGCEAALCDRKAAPEKIQAFLECYGKAVFRFWLRRDTPHLFLRAYLPGLEGAPAEVFLSAILELSRK